jgi:ribonuclease E
MLDSELNNHETNDNGANGPAPREAEPAAPASVPAAVFQAPQVLFQPPAPVAPVAPPDQAGSAGSAGSRGGRGSRGARAAAKAVDNSAGPAAEDAVGNDADERIAAAEDSAAASADDGDEGAGGRRRRRRNGRGRGRSETTAGEPAETDGLAAPAEAGGSDSGAAASSADSAASAEGEAVDADDDAAEDGAGDVSATGRRRRRKRRRGSAADADVTAPDDPPDTVVHVREPHNPADDVRAVKGSTRLEAKKQRRREGRESGRRRPPVITESEFLARRESVERTMAVRQRGDRTQIAVLEDGVLVEHYVNRTTHQSYVGNVYLGKVQNVLPSMEAAFVDIGKGRNAVLYAGEVNFDASGLEGQPKRIESALKPGQSVIVQVTKDPVGHKGARLTSQISLPGRYLVYVPGASMTGISRKLPDTERNRLKQILKKVTPENAGVIVRTAAEGAAEAELDRDVTRLAAQWENIEKKAKTATAPALLYGEPDLTIRVVRDVFNEDFSKLIVSGGEGWEVIDEYVRWVAPHLADRLVRWEGSPDHEDDVFAAHRVDEQLGKALERKVWLPSGGSLVIDRTEAMTVIDVNTGKFTGQGGNLEETVTRNNLEAAEEIVRQLRLRDVGGIVVIDFIDMVLESNRELVLRRLLECLARDRTKHQVAEVTSLGLVQMTRKRVGAGLLEAFSEPCECCNGRGVIITLDQPEPGQRQGSGYSRRSGSGNGNGNGHGNGHGGRSGHDRSGQERSGQESSGRESSGREQSGQGSRRGRRESRAAAASAVDAAKASAADIATADATTAAANGAAAGLDAGTSPTGTGGPVRRTRAGSAMARRSVVPEEPLTVVVASAPVPDAPSPLEATSVPETPAVSGIVPAPETTPAPETLPASEAPLASEPLPISKNPAEDVLPIGETGPADTVPGDAATPEVTAGVPGYEATVPAAEPGTAEPAAAEPATAAEPASEAEPATYAVPAEAGLPEESAFPATAETAGDNAVPTESESPDT